jgi:DNA-binding CsgD family transcriptional regulator
VSVFSLPRGNAMSVGGKLDSIVQNLKCMHDGQTVGFFSKDFAVWNRLFENPIIDCLPVGILLLDINFTICKFNSMYGKYIEMSTGYSAADSIGKNYFDCNPEASVSIVDQFLYVKTTIQQHDSYQHPYTDWESIEQSYWNAHLVPLQHKQSLTGFLLLAMDVTERVNTLKLIDSKNTEIEQLKTTLATILKLKEQLGDEIEEKMLANTKYILAPLVDKLKGSLDNSEHLPYVDGIELVINNLGSGFAQRLGIHGYGLTPKEMQIAVMINVGKTTKEIAECLHISTDSIDFHRKNIRTKLGFKNKSANLQAALSTLLSKKHSPLIP